MHARDGSASVRKELEGDLKILLRLAKKAPAHARSCFGHDDIERTENVENGGLEGSNSLHVLVILRKVLKSYPSHSSGRLEIA